MTTFASPHQPAVSVIIPVYNVENYLRECLDSVVNQTLQSIEIICVNDGSTDCSPDILNEYANKDNRIKFISLENKGVSAARNAGAAIATGKYLYFLDSDDYIELDALGYLYEEAEKHRLDVLYFDGESFFENAEVAAQHSGPDICYREHEYGDIYSGQELFVILRHDRANKPMVWLMFISAKYYREKNLGFREGIVHEDILFSYAIMLQADRVSHRKKAFYHYRRRQGTITGSSVSFRHAYGKFINLLGVSHMMIENNYPSEIQAYTLNSLKWMYSEVVNIFNSLPQEEKNKIDTLSPVERNIMGYILYHENLVNKVNCIQTEQESLIKNTNIIQNELNQSIRFLNQKLSQTQQELDFTNQALYSIQNSISFKIGRAITFVPRKLRGFVLCCRTRGIRYTLKYSVKKLWKLLFGRS